MALRSLPEPRRAGRPKRPLVSAACEANPVLNPVNQVILNPVLAAGHPRGHPNPLRPHWPTVPCTRTSSSWSTWTRRPLAKNLVLVRADQLTKMCSLVRADQETENWSENPSGPRGPEGAPAKAWGLVRADQEAENRPRWLGPRGPARGSPGWLLATVGGEP